MEWSTNRYDIDPMNDGHSMPNGPNGCLFYNV